MFPKLLPLIAKYDLHPDIVEEIQRGNLEFVHEDDDKQFGCLVFEIPTLRERKSAAFLHWHGPDPTTWAMEGIRFYAQRENDGRGSDNLWSPRGKDYEKNVDDFLCWLHLELDE